MALLIRILDDEPLIDGTAPIAGVDNSQPPSAIGPTLAADAENRLTSMDGLNRPRPGVIRLQQASVSFDSIHHVGDGKFLYNDAGAWFLYDSRSDVLNPAPGGPGYAHGQHVYSALSDDKLYFSLSGGLRTGDALYKYTVAAGSRPLFYQLHTISPNIRFGLFSG